MTNRYGSYLAYNYDQDHTNALGCQYTNVTYPDGVNCDVEEDKITVLNIVMALLGPVSVKYFNCLLIMIQNFSYYLRYWIQES